MSEGVRMKSCLLCLTLLFGCEGARAASSEARAYRVEKGLVHVARPGPLAFDLAEARTGAALPLAPVTARITTVESLTSASFAPLSGKVVEAKVRLGDHVTKGQQLVLIRTPDLPTLEREVRSADLSVTTRKASVERQRALVESRAGSLHDLLLAESELAEARLGHKAARARLASLQIARGRDETAYWVLASRSGVVVQLDATVGLQVSPDRGAIATVADLSEVLAVADVPQRDAAELERGTAAQIFPFGPAGETVTGKVEVVSEVVDPDRQTVPVRVRIDNRDRKVRPNAYVDLSFASSSPRPVVRLPANAVVRDGPAAVVFVQDEHGSLVRRAVVVGKRSRDEVEIVSGVVAGERVVTSGALLLLNALDVEV